MLKILWKRGEIAPEEQFLLLSTIICYLILVFYVKTGIQFSLRDKRLFETTEVEITRVDYIYNAGKCHCCRSYFHRSCWDNALVKAPHALLAVLSQFLCFGSTHARRLLHGPSMFAVKAKIYGVLYNQASSIAFDEISSYWSALKSS